MARRVNVIMPVKAEKRLGRLVVSLLQAYHTDEYVHGLVEGDLDEHHESVREDLLEKLQGIQDAAREGVFISESVKSTAESGKSAFESGNGIAEETSGSNAESDDRISRLEESVSHMTSVLEGLAEKLAGGVSFTEEGIGEPVQHEVFEEPVQHEVFEEPVVVSDFSQGDPFSGYDEDLDFEDEEEDVETDAADVMQALTMGMVSTGL